MKHKLLTTLLVGTVMSMSVCFAASAQIQSIELGQPMEDFTVETANAGTFTLSEELEKHDMVLINLWGIFCGPCESEMPFMEEAYSQYKDKVSLVALSIDPNDTPERINAYADEHSLTFPMGSDSETQMFDAANASGVPTSIVVDRFGNVAMITSGAETETSSFTSMFDFFLSDEYTETVHLTHFPGERPVAGVSDEELSENANADGSDLVFHNYDEPLAWPALPEEHDGRKALTFSNNGKENSTGYLKTTVNAAEGDVLAFDLCAELDNNAVFPMFLFTGDNSAFDMLNVEIDGERILSVLDPYDWKTFAIPLSEGEHEVTFSYNAGPAQNAANKVWLSNVHVATEDEAEELYATMPLDGTADEFEAFPAEDLTPIILSSDDNIEQAWKTDDTTTTIHVSLSEDQNPANTIFLTLGKDYASAGGSLYKNGTPSGDGYDLAIPVPEDAFTLFFVIPGLSEEDMGYARSVILANGEKGLDSMVDFYGLLTDFDITWQYLGDEGDTEAADDSANADDNTDADAQAGADASADADVYTVYVVDQNGDPVPGVFVNFCTDESCTPCLTDDNGAAIYDGAPAKYHLQILSVPDGYSFDQSFEDYTEETYSTKTIEITKG